MNTQSAGAETASRVNLNAMILNPMAEGVSELNLRGWLRRTLQAHQNKAPTAKGVIGFLFLTDAFVGGVTRKSLVKMIDANIKKYSMLTHIAVVHVDEGEILTEDECESVVNSFYRPGSNVPDL